MSGAGTLASTSGVTLGNRGTFTLDNTATNLGDRTAGALTSTGGTFNFTHGGAAATSYAESVGALSLNAGALTINGSQAAVGQTSSVTLASITRVAGGTLQFTGTGAGVDARNELLLTAISGLPASGVLIPWAIVNDGTGTSFAQHTGVGTTLKRYAGTVGTGAVSTWVAATDARPAADDSTNNAARSVNTITLDSGIDLLGTALSADRIITMSGAGGGAFLQTGGTSTITNNGTSSYQFAFGANEALFHTLGSLEVFTGSTADTNLTGTGGLTKTGAGTLIVRGTSTITGIYRVNEGILEGRIAGSFGTSQATHLNGGTLRLSNDTGITFTTNATVNADSTIQVDRVTPAATATTQTLSSLSIGGGRTLTVNSNDITSGTAYGFTATALTLTSGGATLDVANNGAGLGTMSAGSISGAFPLIKAGAGDLLVNSVSAGYTGPVDIQAGRVGWGGSTGTISEAQIFSGAGGLIKSGVVVVNLSGANTFTGGVTVSGGTLGFSTVSDNGGSASNLGQGTDGITLSGGTLSFIGGTSQSTNRAITVSTASTLSANGTAGATITYNGAISAGTIGITLTGTTGSVGIIAGGISQTDDAADATINGGTWRHQTGTSRIGDDTTLTGANSILHLDSGLLRVRDDFTVTAGANLNLNATGVLSFSTATLSADASLRATGGATITLGANNAVVVTDLDGIRIGTDAAGVGTLAMGTFNQTATDFILGNRQLDRSGLVTGTGILTATTNIDLFGGTVNANIAYTAASATFEKFSMNTVTLLGDNSGITSTGATIVNEGTLILDYSVSTATKVRAASTLDMRGSNLTLNGNASSAVAQSVSSLTLASGGSNVITLNTAGGQDLVLNLNAITRGISAQDGTMRFVLPSGTQSATNGITTDTLNTLGTGANAILGGWATVNDGTGVFFARNATNAADGNIVAATTTLEDTIGSWVAGDNVSDNTLGFSGTLDGISLNSLRFNANAASAVAINSGGVLGVNSGGILMTSAAATGAHTISGGRLVAGGQELIFTQDSAVGLEVSSTITGNTALTKAGNGTLTLSGGNDFTGALTIQSGTVIASGGNAIGNAAAVTMGDERINELQLTANETIGSLSGGSVNVDQLAGNVNIGSNTLTINQSASATYAGVFTGNGSIVRNGASGGANLQFTGNSGAGFTGTITLNGGLTYLSGATTINASAFTLNKGSSFLIDNNGTTTSGARILNTATITLNSADGAWSGETRPSGLAIRRDQGSTQSETVGLLSLNSGASYARLDASVASAIAQIITDNITRSNNATLDVRGTNMSATANQRAQLRIGTAGNQTAFIAAMVGGGSVTLGADNISIVPWAIAEDVTGSVGDTNMGNSLATYVSGQGFRALTLGTEYNTYTASVVATENIRESLTANLTGLTGKTINALVLHNNNTAAGTINVTGSGAGQTLALTAGTMLFTTNTAAAASAAMGIALGGFDAGITTAGANPEYALFVQNPSSVATTAVVTATISSPLTSTADITKSGRGILILSGSNTAGGNTKKTTINEGTLQIADLDNIGGGTGGLVFAGGILKLDGTFNVGTDDISGRTLTFLQGGGTIDTGALNPIFASSLGSGSGTFTKTGAGNLTLNAATTLTGASVVAAGTVTMGADQAIGSGDLSITAGATLDMGIFNATVGNITLPNSATVALTGTGTLTGSGTMTVNRGAVSPVLAGSMNLIKQTASQTVTISSAANTFTGFTHVQNGTLSIDSLANAGSNSSLGAPVAGDNAAIRLGSTTTTGVLLITATTGTGGTTDRPFWLTGTTGSGTIDNDGTAALTLNGIIRSMEYGAKTLTLQGATTGFDNVLNGIIDQPVGTVALTKAEAGTWVLANTTSPSTYTGINTVTAGTLQVNRATGGLGDSTAVNAINLNGGTLSLRNNGAGNNGTIIYGSASNATGYNVQLAATSTINVDNLTANTGNTIQLGPLTQAAAAARTLNVTGANGYTLTLASLGLSPGTGQTTTLIPTTASLIITGNVTNPMSGFSTTNFDTIVLDGTSTGNVIGGTISDAAVGGFTPVLLGGYTIVTKSNTSTWTLDGTGSTYTGNTNINGGVLIAGTDTSLGGSLISFGGGTLDNQNENRTLANNVLINATTATLTGTGDFSFTGNLSQTGGSRILALNNTGTVTFGDASTDTITLAENSQTRTLTLNVAGTAAAVINATVQDGTGTGADGLIKLGAGSLSINASNTYTGTTTLDNGAITFTANQSLTTTTNTLIIGSAAATVTPVTIDFDDVNATFGGALTMNVNNATASTITIDSTKTLAINNNVQIGTTTPAVANTVTKLNITGGGSFNVITAAAGTFIVGGSTSSSTTNGADTTLNLTGLSATTIDVSNTGTFRVSNSASGNVNGSLATLLLPTPVVSDTTATTSITANNFNVGDGGSFNNQAGQINSVIFGTGLTTLNANTFNIGNGNRDFGQMIYGSANGDLVIRGAAGGSSRAAFNMATGGGGTGTFNATVFNLFDVTGHSADLLFGAVNIGAQSRNITSNNVFSFDTGTLDMTSLTMSTRTGGTGTPVTNSTMNLGGTGVTIIGTGSGTAVTLSTASTGTTANATINLTASSDTTIAGNVVRGGGVGTTSATINLQDSATLNMSGFSIGDASNLITFNAESGTLKNLGEFNGGAVFTKSAAGTLTMDGTNTYTGGTAIEDGTVIAFGGADNRMSSAGLTLGNLTTSGVLQLGNSSGASNQTVTALATSGTGTSNAIVGGNATFSTLTVNQTAATTFNGNLGGGGTNENKLNLVKNGTGQLTVSGAMTYTGSTSVTGGTLVLAGTVNGTPSLNVTGSGSTLALTGPVTSASAVTSISVADGSTLSLLNGTGDKLNSLTSLALGSASGTMTYLNFNVGDVSGTDQANTDKLTLLTGGTLGLFAGNQITLNLTDAGLNPSQQYDLLASVDGGLITGVLGIGDWLLGGTPGGFTSITLTKTDTLMYITTGALITGDLYWRGLTNATWNGNVNNWSTDKAGATPAATTPGQGTDVIFSYDGVGTGALTTTLEQNFKVNSLTFEAGTTTPSSVTIDPGAVSTNRIEVAPQVATDGVQIAAGGSPTVIINSPFKLGNHQTWNVFDSGSSLIFTHNITGTAGTTNLDINAGTSAAGTVILRGVNGLGTYTGTTGLVAGRLILEGGANDRLPTATALTMGSATTGATLQLGDAVNGASSLTIGTLNTGSATTNAIVGGGATASILTVVQGTAGSFNGAIGGAGTNENQLALIKLGSATLVLNGANSYLGSTTVNTGILQLGSTATLTQSSGLIVNASAGATATFDNNSRPTVLTGGITLGGADTSAAPQIINTGGTGSITLGGNILYDATNDPLGGSIAAPLILGGTARTFTANDSVTAATDLAISGAVSSTAGSVGANGIGLILDGTGTGLVTGAIALANGTTDGTAADLTKNGVGAWTIQNSVTVGDNYNINAGTFTVSGSGSLTWNSTGSADQDFVADTTSAPIVNFDVANAIVGSGNTNRIFARDGSTININATNAIGSSIEQIILGDDNQGIGNLFLAGSTTNSVGRLDIGSNSVGEQGQVTGTGTLTVTTNLNLNNGTVVANLSGAAATLKDTTLTVTLSGDNSLTGTTTIQEGMLTADYAAYAGTNNKLGTGNFTIGSATHNELRGVLNLIGHATTASRQDVANFTVAGGPTQINLTGTSGVDNILRITGTLSRSAGTVNFSLGNANTKLEYSGATTNTNGILPAWMILNRSDFATIAENGVVDDIVVATYTTLNNASLWSTGQNITNSAAFTGTVDADCNTINSLRFNAAAASMITIGSGNLLIVSSGGVMTTANVGANASVITGGSLVSGTNEFFFHQNNTASTLTVGSTILGSATITKTGNGVLVLSGVNNQTGAVIIEEGRIRLSGGSAISDTSGVTIRSNGGSGTTGLELAASQTETIGTLTANTTAASIVLNTGSVLTIIQGSAQTMPGVVSGAGTLLKSGGSSLTFTGTSTMTGTIRADQGQIILSGSALQFATATALVLNGTGSLSNVQDQTSATSINRINNSATVLLNNTAAGSGLALDDSEATSDNGETVGALTLGAGHNVITATSSVAANVGSLTFASLAARNNRATALVRGINLGDSGQTQRGQIIFTAAPGGGNVAVGGGGAAGTTNISIFPWLIGDVTAAGLGNSFVRNTGTTNGLKPLTASEYTTDAAEFDALTEEILSNNNLRFTTGATLTGTATGVNSLVIDAATAQTVTGPSNTFEITSGAILAASTGTTITHTLGGFTAITTGGGLDYMIYVTSTTGTLTISSPLTSAVPLVKSGAGTLSLTAASTGNQFTDIYMNQGTVLADDLDRLGTGTLRFFGGGIRLAAGFADDLSTKTWDINTGGGTIDVGLVTTGTTFANGIDDSTVSASDTLNIFTRATGATGGVGQLTIQGASSFTGTTIIRNSGIASGIINGVVLNGTTNAAINGNLEIGNVTNINDTFDAVVALGASEQIVDTASITTRGASGENAYFKLMGFTETVAGISDTTREGVIENVENSEAGVTTNGKLIVNSSQDFSYNAYLRNRGSGTNAFLLEFEKQGTGTQTLSGDRIVYSGATTISGGTLQLTDTTAFSALSTITNNANLTINRTTSTQTFANVITGTGTLTKLGAGTVTLSGASSYSGQTNIEQGVLSISASNNLGDASATNDISIANLSTLQVTANVNLGADRALVLSGTGGRVEVTGTNTLTVSGVIAGDECCGLVKEGTGNMVLTNAANTWTGSTSVNAGILQVGSAGTGSTGTGDISVASGATLAGSGTVQGSVILNGGAVLQAGDVTTIGTAVTTETGSATLTFTPVVTAASGSEIRLGITTSTNSTLDPFFGGVGSPNEVGGAAYLSYVQGFAISAAGNHDKLIFNAAFNFSAGSEIVVKDSPSFTGQLGQIFNLIDWSAPISGFAVGTNYRDGSSDGGVTDDFDLPTLAGGLFWDVSMFESHGLVVVVPEPSRTLFLMLGLLGLMLRRRRRQI